MPVIYEGPKSSRTSKGESATPRMFQFAMTLDLTGSKNMLTEGRIRTLMEAVEQAVTETLDNLNVEFKDLSGEWNFYYPMHYGRVVS